MLVSEHELFEGNGVECFRVNSATNSWEITDMFTNRTYNEGLFLLFGKCAIVLWGELPGKIKQMMKKRGIEFISVEPPKSMWFGALDTRQSIIFEHLRVFAVCDYDNGPKIIAAGTYEYYENTKQIYNFDGCFGLPRETAVHLRRLGYNLSEIEKYIVNK